MYRVGKLNLINKLLHCFDYTIDIENINDILFIFQNKLKSIAIIVSLFYKSIIKMEPLYIVISCLQREGYSLLLYR